MKAIYLKCPGDITGVVYGDRPDPEPRPGEVLLRVRSSALNHADLNLISGETTTCLLYTSDAADE